MTVTPSSARRCDVKSVMSLDSRRQESGWADAPRASGTQIAYAQSSGIIRHKSGSSMTRNHGGGVGSPLDLECRCLPPPPSASLSFFSPSLSTGTHSDAAYIHMPVWASSRALLARSLHGTTRFRPSDDGPHRELVAFGWQSRITHLGNSSSQIRSSDSQVSRAKNTYSHSLRTTIDRAGRVGCVDEVLKFITVSSTAADRVSFYF